MNQVLVYKGYKFAIKEHSNIFMVNGKKVKGNLQVMSSVFYKKHCTIDEVYDTCRKYADEH